MTLMKKSLVILCIATGVSSCLVFSPYTRTGFTYNQGARTYTLPVVVPRGFTREKTEIDSSGNTILSYTYGNGAWFYVAHLEDTTAQLQAIPEGESWPQIFLPNGALVFKGMDSAHLYWREIRRKDLRFGYRFVPGAWESRFDSATNYGMVQKF